MALVGYAKVGLDPYRCFSIYKQVSEIYHTSFGIVMVYLYNERVKTTVFMLCLLTVEHQPRFSQSCSSAVFHLRLHSFYLFLVV